MHRRDFLGTSAGAVVAAALPTVREYSAPRRHFILTPTDLVTLHDPKVKALALTALDAAQSTGASYADVRLTYTRARVFLNGRPWTTQVDLGLSVRALVNGYWGWAATSYVAEAEAPRVGREATLLAQATAKQGKARPIEWGTIPVIQDGTWSTPIRIDPFTVAAEEVCDWMQGFDQYVNDLGKSQNRMVGEGWYRVRFNKQERVFASTEGNYLTQTVYVTGLGSPVANLRPAQGGWEYILDAPLRDRARQEMDRQAHIVRLPEKSFLNVGRYDLVCTAETMATLLAQTLAPAAEVDRALGYEANASGTSYLGPDPLTQLGTQIAASPVTVTADRSNPQGVATIRWDEEGVIPDNFTLVKEGVLVDYQTTREQAAWLTPWYQKHGAPIRSHGCAAAGDALSVQMQHTPNLTLQPGTAALKLEDLIANVDHGLLIGGIEAHLDFQHLNGLGKIGGNYGGVSIIQQGRLVARLKDQVNYGLLFRSPELWKNVIALGGPASLESLFEVVEDKGEPSQATSYSLATVPAFIKQVALIDLTRKA